MKTTKATEEINKAKNHLLKAKKEMSNYAFHQNPNDFLMINRIGQMSNN